MLFLETTYTNTICTIINHLFNNFVNKVASRMQLNDVFSIASTK